jgi:hypothetical protein
VVDAVLLQQPAVEILEPRRGGPAPGEHVQDPAQVPLDPGLVVQVGGGLGVALGQERPAGLVDEEAVQRQVEDDERRQVVEVALGEGILAAVPAPGQRPAGARQPTSAPRANRRGCGPLRRVGPSKAPRLADAGDDGDGGLPLLSWPRQKTGITSSRAAWGVSPGNFFDYRH